MLIKKKPESWFGRVFVKQVLKRLRQLMGFKRVLVGLFVLVLLLVVYVVGVYQGAFLRAKHKELIPWVREKGEQAKNYVPNYVRGVFTDVKRIDIDIKYKNFQKIIYTRNEALKYQRLVNPDEGWVPCAIRYDGATYKASLRLKGELADHWNQPDGWSYKVKIKGDNTLFGMKRFAMQRPVCREYLDDWILQALMKHCKLIYLRYDFVEATVNGKAQPIYLIEENYEKRLIENNDRRAGPILQFDMSDLDDYVGPVDPLTDYKIDVYEGKKLTEDEVFARQYGLARNLLRSFSLGELPASQVFDVEQLAMMYAILDVLGAHHVAILMNMRFYYNPVTSLLEPIAQDNSKLKYITDEGIWGTGRALNLDGAIPDHRDYQSVLFSDPVFFQAYVRALEKVSGDGFLEAFQNIITPELLHNQSIINKSEPAYNFDGWKIMYSNRNTIRKILSAKKSLTVFLDGYDSQTRNVQLAVNNYLFLPVELHGLMVNDEIVSFETDELLQARLHAQTRFQRRKPFTLRWSDPVNYQPVAIQLPPEIEWTDTSKDNLKLVYSIYGSEQKVVQDVNPVVLVDRDVFESDFIRRPGNVDQFSFLNVDEDEKLITIEKGIHQLNESMIIPSGYRVICQSPTTLELLDNVMILSYSPLLFEGTEDMPVRIQTAIAGQGVAVMNTGADNPSKLSYVVFDGLSAVKQGNWELTSAVTFYQAAVNIDHCQFTNNSSEDGLNIVRSDFDIRYTLFADTFSDAFDSDFSKGCMVDCTFARCGNDAIDVSGTRINLEDITILACGDKGLSGGEVSYIEAKNVRVIDSEIAIAAKDLTDIFIQEVVLHNCRVGFALYQKKPEYGPAVVDADNVTSEDVSEAYLVEKGSTLLIDEMEIPAVREKVEDMLYGVEYGKSSH